MSAFAGLVRFDGESADPLVRAHFEKGLRARGPDGVMVEDLKEGILAFGAFQAVATDLSAFQPYVDRDLAVTFDGRVDNRDDLVGGIREPRSAVVASDVGLIAALYKDSGASCFHSIVGDFAIALVERTSLVVHLVRDPFGSRPLFYSVGAHGVTWSTELDLLVGLLGCRPDPEDDFVAAYLTTSDDSQLTPYRSIRGVPPGFDVVVTRSSVRKCRFWQPDPSRQLRYRSDEAYAEHFRALFLEAVNARLRSHRPILAELSGGIDSSSIACAAHHLATLGRARAPRIETVSYVYPDSPTSDESRFVAAVEAHIGQSSRRVEVRDVLGSIQEAGCKAFPNPALSFQSLFTGLETICNFSGARILLSGQAGDHLMMQAAFRYPHLADLLVNGHILTLCRYLGGFHREWKFAYAHLIWSSVVWPLLPRALRARLPDNNSTVPSWLDRRFAARTHFADRWLNAADDGGFVDRSKQWQYSLLHEAISMSAACYYRERICVDVTYPYLHRPLVEFLLSIPSDQIVRPAETRSIQRRAMRGILPELVRKRKSKAGQGEVMCRALARQWPNVRKLVDTALIVARGYVDRDRFQHELQRARFGVSDGVAPLYRALVLEAWLRCHEDDRRITSTYDPFPLPV